MDDALRQLADIAVVTDGLNDTLDALFRNVAELKVILAGAGPDARNRKDPE